MEDKTKSVIDLLTAALGAMAERCVKAERKRDEAEESQREWYEISMQRGRDLKAVNMKLEAEIAEHQKTRQALQYALTPERKGEG